MLRHLISIFCIFAIGNLIGNHPADGIVLEENREDLPISYIANGESYLLLGKFEEAHQSFLKGRTLIETSELPSHIKPSLELRSTFGLMLANSGMGENEEALCSAEYCQRLINDWDCNQLLETIYAKDEGYVIGPDQAPYPGWCQETVNSTSSALKFFVRLCPLKAVVRESIVFTIDQAQTKALHCCRMGGLWKACVGPLARKLYEWKVLGVTPDPAWD